LIEKVLEVVPDGNEDEITIALYQHDYDVEKTIDFLLEGGKATEDWVTAGTRKKPPATTTTDADTTEPQNQPRRHNKNNPRSDQPRRNNQPNDSNYNKSRPKRPVSSGQTNQESAQIEDQLVKIDLTRDDAHADAENRPRYNNRVRRDRQSNEFNSEDSSNVNGDSHNQRRSFNSNQRNYANHNGNYKNGAGPRNLPPRLSGENGRRRHENNKNANTDGEGNVSQPVGNESAPNTASTTVVDTKTVSYASFTAGGASSTTVVASSTTTVSSSVDSGKNREDNLKHIGTWNPNESAAQANGRVAKQNPSNNNSNTGRYSNGKNSHQADDWENNDEEWQGDLSKPQIFTSSAQKKEGVNFPIGHFKAEEAAEKIKKAVGVSFIFFEV
jgi:hypothetical protein